MHNRVHPGFRYVWLGLQIEIRVEYSVHIYHKAAQDVIINDINRAGSPTPFLHEMFHWHQNGQQVLEPIKLDNGKSVVTKIRIIFLFRHEKVSREVFSHTLKILQRLYVVNIDKWLQFVTRGLLCGTERPEMHMHV